MTRWSSILVLVVLFSPRNYISGQEEVRDSRKRNSVDEQAKFYVPQVLLGLVHDDAMHKELELNESKVADLEELFLEIDGDWFRARNLSAVEQHKKITTLESKFLAWAESNFDEKQKQRLKQIELQAQGVRAVIRPDVSKQLNLTGQQIAALVSKAKSTYDVSMRQQQALQLGKPDDGLAKTLQAAVTAEKNGITENLRPEQLKKLGEMLGERFDTISLDRIYPMAPEIEPVEHWINSSPLELANLRGKVVLVHFYAFQCHNCHANFKHYDKWHEKLREKGVVVLGIQTPETSAERDPKAVMAAAIDRNIKYPVLIDLESKNWTAWGNTMWPTVYVVDKNGYLRMLWQGELNWQGATVDQTIEQLVEKLILEDS